MRSRSDRAWPGFGQNRLLERDARHDVSGRERSLVVTRATF